MRHFTRLSSHGMPHHRHHLFSDPHTRTRAELQLIADHHRDRVPDADTAEITRLDTPRIDAPANDEWSMEHQEIVTHQRIA